jgi:hypothetical protein
MYGQLAGPAEDALANTLANTFAKAITASVTGKPGSVEEKQRIDFYSRVLSQTGEKFVDSPSGQKVVNKTLYFVAVPALVLGLVAGYYLFRKRA